MERKNRKTGVDIMEREMRWNINPSPVFYKNSVNSYQEIKKERDFYAGCLEFITLASLVQEDPKASGQDDNEANTKKIIHFKLEKSIELSYRCCLHVGYVFLIIGLLTTSISLLLLYLQVGALQRNGQEEADELRMNLSWWQQELELQQEIIVLLHRNISSLIQDHNALHKQTLSHLQHKEKEHLQKTERLVQKYQELYSNYSTLQEAHQELRESHLLIPRESALLQNCQKKPTGDDGVVCPFCPSGWLFFGVSCYMLSHCAETWQENLIWCRMEGGHLAVVNNLEEQYFLQGLVKKTSWIGLSDRDLEGDWHWVDGTSYNETIKSWMFNQPDNYDKEDCVTISPVSGWSDEKCLKSYHSVCEHRAYQLVLDGDTISN